jgi:hypothetical protein
LKPAPTCQAETGRLRKAPSTSLPFFLLRKSRAPLAILVAKSVTQLSAAQVIQPLIKTLHHGGQASGSAAIVPGAQLLDLTRSCGTPLKQPCPLLSYAGTRQKLVVVGSMR